MIEKYLEYQAEDRKLFDIERELRGSDAARLYHKLKHIMVEATEQIQKLDKEAEELMKTVIRSENALRELEEQIADMGKVVDEAGDLQEIEYHCRNYDKVTETFTNLEKEILRSKARIAEIRKSYDDLMTKGKEANEKAKVAKAEYEKLKAEKIDEVNKLTESLEKLKTGLDPHVMEAYEQLRKNNKLPAFVPLKGASCGGCGMDLSVDTRNKLKSAGDHAECPNCHRFIYVK